MVRPNPSLFHPMRRRPSHGRLTLHASALSTAMKWGFPSADPGAVTYGASFTLTGRVTRADTSVAPNPVGLRAYYDNGTSSYLGPVTLGGDGTFSKVITAKPNAVYVATYGGDSKNDGTVSTGRLTAVVARISANFTARTTASPAS